MSSVAIGIKRDVRRVGADHRLTGEPGERLCDHWLDRRVQAQVDELEPAGCKQAMATGMASAAADSPALQACSQAAARQTG